ncbi:THAP domain-containing protein [Phthorimaea operculella]|nr:THAP domain-containing protein [Phthorimaea operculella]
MTSYKTCAVPLCNSTTILYPEKLFIHVPKCPKRRKQWLRLARRDTNFTSDKSAVFFCEDHFDLPNDMENYIRYSVMGSVGKIKMKSDCLPSKFQCQPDRMKRTAPPQPRSAVSKRQRKDILQEIFAEDITLPADIDMTPATSGMTNNSDFLSTAEMHDFSFQDQATQVCPETSNKNIQVCSTTKFRSKYVQTCKQALAKDKSTSTFKTDFRTTATSPVKIKCAVELTKNASNSKKILSSEYLEELTSDTSPSVQSLVTMASTSSDQSELYEIKRKVETEHLNRISIENTVQLIKTIQDII